MVHSKFNDKWIVYIFVTLLCLVLTSFYMISNMYARYSSSASGSDGARVAKFSVTQSGIDTQKINIDGVYPGFEHEYMVSVINDSEVAISYVMDVVNKTKNLPLEFKMMDGDKEITSKSVDISATDHGEHTYKLVVSWPKNEADEKYAGQADWVEITLKAVQKD